jgi:nucleoside-diphosphate-sugar epimerase
MVHSVDYVVHNAGVVKARRKGAFFEVNEKGTASLFEAIAENNPSVRRVIHISSLAAAGPSIAGRVITEDDAPHPVSAYGRSKLAGEEVALSFADRFEVVVLRPSGVYGPGDREVFTFFEAVNKGVRPLLGDLNRKIQMVHVDDLCRAVYLAVMKKARSGEVYHIVENQAYTYRELVDVLVRASGRRCLPLRLPGFLFWLAGVVSGKLSRAVGAAPMLTRDKAVELLTSWEVSSAKAKRDFGFESQIPFAEGAKETFDWYRKQGWLR